MRPHYRFSFAADWRHAPMAYWVHVPLSPGGDAYWPPAPPRVPHRGYPLLHVSIGGEELCFSAPAQLDHCIDVLMHRLLPTSRQLSLRRGTGAGPNGHWLSRLPAKLKSPRMRARVVKVLRAVRADVVAGADSAAFRLAARDAS